MSQRAELHQVDAAPRTPSSKARRALALPLLLLSLAAPVCAQTIPQSPALGSRDAAHARARRFLHGRTTRDATSPAVALDHARTQHLALPTLAKPRAATSLSAAWQPVGPAQVLTPAFGPVTGRITALVIDPADSTGNTVYLGTSGGGVWKSTNASGPAAQVTFAPLTDTLPVFSPSAGSSVTPSLSIGALALSPSAGGGILLAGTGDPGDATDSYYGEGILRSADGGST